MSEKLLGKVEPKTEGQRRLLDALLSDRIKIVGVFGPTGTGKSLLSSAYGVDAVSKGRYERFIITRPVVDITTGRELTSIELGDLYYKIASEYLFDLLSAAVPREELSKMIEDGRIIVADPHFLRGRTFDNSVIFFDDVQSASPENVGEVIMRIGEGSKLIVAGDPIFQRDPRVRLDGATLVREVLLGEEEAAVIDLGLRDIVRPGAKRGIRLALEFRMRKRELSETESKILESIRIHAPDADVVTVVADGLPTDVDALMLSLDGVRRATIVSGRLTLETAVGSKALPRVVQALSGTGADVMSIKVTSPNLESVFLHLTGKTLDETHDGED